MSEPIPEEAPQEAIDAYLAAHPGEDEADARAEWAAARQKRASDKKRRRHTGAITTGILIAIADNDQDAADILIGSLDLKAVPDAIMQHAAWWPRC